MQAESAAPAGATGFPDFPGFEDAAAAAEPAAPAYAPASPPDDLEGAPDGPAAAHGGAPRARPALRACASRPPGLAWSRARSAPRALMGAHKRALLSRMSALPRLQRQRCAPCAAAGHTARS